MKKQLLNRKRISNLLYSLGLFLLFLSAFNVQAQIATDGDYRTAKATGNWDDTDMWQVRTAGGTWATTATPPSATSSTSGNNVYIQTGHRVTLNAAVSCLNLHIKNASSTGIILGNYDINVYGKMRAYTETSGAITGNSDGAFYSGQTSVGSGSFSFTLSYTTTGKINFIGQSRIVFATGEWTGSASGTYPPLNFNLDPLATASIQVPIKFQGVTITNGTVDSESSGKFALANAGNFLIRTGTKLTIARNGQSINGSTSTAICDKVTIEEGAILELKGSTPVIDCTTFENQGTVIYNSSSSLQTFLTKGAGVGAVDIVQYKDVILNGSSSKTLSTNSTKGSNYTVSGVLTIASGDLTVPTGKKLTIGSIVNNGILTLENNANLIQTGVTDLNTGSGNTIVKRNSNDLYRLDYTSWSSPVSGTQTLEQFSPLTSQSPNRFYTYDTASNQYDNTNNPTTATFDQAAGYLIRMPNDASAVTPTAYAGEFTGVLNNGTISKAISDSGSGYNMIGNPYASTISADAFMIDNTASIESIMYFWRRTNLASGSAYATYTPLGGTGTNPSESGVILTPNGSIQIGQGFFVKAKTGATSVSFTNAMRETMPTSTQFFRTKKADQLDRVWLNLTNASGAFSQALVGYSTNATLGVDGYDGPYFNDSPTALTSDINGEEYTIQGRPAFDVTDVVPLNFKTDAAGDYTIAIDHADGVFAAGQDIYLVDNVKSLETNLKTDAYTFTATNGTANSRFSLKYQKTLKVDASTFNENCVTVYRNGGTLYINSGGSAINTIKVFDMQGRLIAEQKNVNANATAIKNLKANQVFVVQVISGDSIVVNKKVVN
jgi:hypothetical protein